MRGILLGAIATGLVTACGASSGNRDAKVGSGADACWATESRCRRDNDCCSQWCVSGSCERREP